MCDFSLLPLVSYCFRDIDLPRISLRFTCFELPIEFLPVRKKNRIDLAFALEEERAIHSRLQFYIGQVHGTPDKHPTAIIRP